jgi:hypothetical protein
MAQSTGAVVAVDAVGVTTWIFFFGRLAERAIYGAGPSRIVDAAEAENGRGKGTAEHDALAFEEAPARVALGFGRRLLVHPLPLSLRVNTGAGDEDEAPEAPLRRESREEVAEAIYVGGSVGLVRGPGRRGGVDEGVEVRGQSVGWQRSG